MGDGITDYLLTEALPHRVLVLRHFDAVPDDAGILLDLLVGTGRWHLLFGRRFITS
jgi:hypothetical protein